jgi:hypothetical protein
VCVCACVCVYVCVYKYVCVSLSVGCRGGKVDIEMQDRDSQNFMRKRKTGKIRYPLIPSQEVGAWVR